jgi:hypothetical protein
VSRATLARWAARQHAGRPLRARPEPRAAALLAPEPAAQVEQRVRQLHGLIGAEALRHSVPGISRRRAAAIKRATLTAMERERVAAADRVVITVPGVLRGVDAMHVGARYLLLASDGGVPYRTSVAVTTRYDAPAVARLLERDLTQHGAPLVYRLDRARAHRAAVVQDVLREAEALLLQGPPRYPYYYGQLERQNREHRAWLDTGPTIEEDLDEACQQMLVALNEHWPRAALGWQTPAECWHARPRLADDRAALREEVQERAARIQQHLQVRGQTADVAERLAIEEALTDRGYLRRERGGWC